MKYLKLYILTFTVCIACPFSFSQNTDSTNINSNDFISNQLENISSSKDQILDYTDLLDEYAYYYKNPISINGNNLNKLVDLLIINENQYQNILDYKSEYGNIRSEQELLIINGIGTSDVERIMAFISFSNEEVKTSYSFKDVFKYGNHQLISRYSQILEKSQAYSLPKDSAISNKGGVYLGGPQKIYTRYSYNYNKKAGIGFTLEKDAGEAFGKYGLNDSLKILLNNKVKLVDFSSAHLYLTDIGILKKIIIGDYHLEFGQGLTLWSGLSFGKSSDATMLKKYGRGLVKNTSVNENRFMRGVAVSLAFKKLQFTAFYSTNTIDANTNNIDSIENSQTSGLLETGNHRTINELLDAKTQKVNSLGGNLSYKLNDFRLGFSFIHNSFSLQFKPQNEIYKKYYFTGKENLNMGIDFVYNIKNVHFFGEISTNERSSVAGIIGNNIFIGKRIVLSFLYRNYPKDYFNFFNNPIKESTYARNEKAYYLGLKFLVLKNVSIDAYADFIKYPWFKYGIPYPSNGVEYLIQINYNPLNKFHVYFRFRTDYKSYNNKDEYKPTAFSMNTMKQSFRLNISYSALDILTFKTRYESVIYKKGNIIEKAYLLYQDLIFSNPDFPLSGNLRYAIFSTDGWNSRIYAYENDVLYSFSIPAYYDKGQRFYFNLKYKLNRRLNLWFRISRIIFNDKTTIGTGSDLINSNHKTEVKFQLKLNL